MIDFRKLMSPKALERHDGKVAEIERLYGLCDRSLGRALLLHARSARSFTDIVYGADPQGQMSYHAMLFSECVPEIAARLGETLFLGSERSERVCAMSHFELRNFAARLIARDIYKDRRYNHAPDAAAMAYRVLVNDACNGNPIAFALDRFVFADLHEPDALALEVYHVAESRGHIACYEWRPDYNDIPILRPDFHVAPAVRI